MQPLGQHDVFARLDGIFESTALSNRTAVVIGLGSGGSLVAVELAKCAVGRFRLIDFDRLEPQNISRHVCGVRDLGRFKTEAVREAILNFNPFAAVECYDINVIDESGGLPHLLIGADIVLVCTDTDRSRYTANQALINLWFEKGVSIPAVYAGAYERAFGGQVLRVVPGETPCFDCVLGSLQRLPFMETKPRSAVAYSDLANADSFRAEPGLGMDVHFIALIQAKFALLTLLRGAETILEDIPYNFLFWGNRKEWIFPEPLKCIFATTEKRVDCSTCGDRARDSFSTEKASLLQQAHEILQAATAPSADLIQTPVVTGDPPEDQ